MTTREWTSAPGMRLALAGLVLASGAAAWALVRAVRADQLPEAAVESFATADALAPHVAAPTTDIRAAVDADPFQDDRSAPALRYRMPGDSDPTKAPPSAEPDKPVVLGVAVTMDGTSFATCTLTDDRARIVHVGDKLGIYTVLTIERGRVVFTTANGKPLEVRPLR
jgi:hypothetical protein